MSLEKSRNSPAPGLLSDSSAGPCSAHLAAPPRATGTPDSRLQRHGTTTLFAAFNILNGKVIAAGQARHRSRQGGAALAKAQATAAVSFSLHTRSKDSSLSTAPLKDPCGAGPRPAPPVLLTEQAGNLPQLERRSKLLSQRVLSSCYRKLDFSGC